MASRTEIASKIIIELEKEKPLKAIQLADILSKELNEDIDKKEINSVLYSILKDQVSQNSRYQWQIKQSGSSQPTTTSVNAGNQDLSRLASYYLECISSELDGISLFAKSKYKLQYAQTDEIDPHSPPEQTDDINRIKKEIINKRAEQSFSFGYPFYLKKVKSRKGEIYEWIEPIFYLTYDTDSFFGGGIPKLADEQFKINPSAIKSIVGVDRGDLLDELVDLQEKLGLIDPFNIPDLDELMLRLKELKPEWPWKEEIDPNSPSDTELDKVEEEGIFNVAAYFPSQRSKFTRGLETELLDYKNKTSSEIKGTALSNWLSNDFQDATRDNGEMLLEPIPLNEEQRIATKKALTQKLTVVTGPPGTGKSQIVTSILINSAFNKQSVIFSSKNNQAVDVVVKRGNSITDRPLVLRLGRDDHQADLLSHLTTLISTGDNTDDRNRYENAKRAYNKLIKEHKVIDGECRKVISLRNEVDELEKNLNDFLKNANDKELKKYKKLKDEDLTILGDQIDLLKEQVKDLDIKKQDFLTKLFWPAVVGRRTERVKRTLETIKPLIKKVYQKYPSFSNMDFKDLTYSYNWITSIENHISHLKSYLVFYNKLIELKNAKSLFQLSQEAINLNESIHKASISLYDHWLKIMATQLNAGDRKSISDFTSVLQLIENARQTDSKLAGKIWKKYYKLLPAIQKTLPCWAVTSLSVKSKVPSVPAFFDLLVIDEASQCDIASALPLLFRAKRVVIIGDPKQLTHISQISESQDIQLLGKYELDDKYMNWGYSTNSLFALAAGLVKGENIVNLKDHHRSHKNIIDFSNRIFYDGGLRVATKYENLKGIKGEPAVRWIDVNGNASMPRGGSVENFDEAKAVVDELQRVVDTNYDGTIGVVTPYRAQANLIMREVSKRKGLNDSLLLRNWLCNTVHLFQGDEKDMMIFSPVLSMGLDKMKTRFMSKQGNLFNVAITRARAVLTVVGSKSACSSFGISYLEKFVNYINELKDNEITDKIDTKDYGPEYPEIGTDVMVSDWEKKLYRALYKKGIVTVPQYNEEQYSLDLALFDGERKLDIEVDGEKYHRKWDGELMTRDQIRNRRLIELGWDVRRFWVYELKDDMEGCCELIQNWLDNSQ